MKIAFLNPWRNAAESQMFHSVAMAACRLGHELVECANSTDVEKEAPDFVMAGASTQPKLNDIPQYALVHEPRHLFMTDRCRYNNILTADGFMTISDSLQRFMRDITFVTGNSPVTGYYFNTGGRQEIAADLPALYASSALKLTYFGTNWDVWRAEVATLLAEHKGVQIYGPEHSWRNLPPKAYGGCLPFDGKAVQRKYAENGVGLCLLAQEHYRDDVVSGRPFEIVSVGAIAICPDMPWLRKHFGDSLYYFDQSLPTRFLVRQILMRYEEILGNPDVAMAKARKAREIFEQTLCSEILLANAVAYHEQVSARRRRELADAPPPPLISVIIRCGSRPPGMVRRAIESVAGQSYGQFEIILVRHSAMDLSELTELRFPNVREIRAIDAAPGKRSTSLWAGLAVVRGGYFAVLDDDDWLFHNHFERLFSPLSEDKPKPYFAYSGAVAEAREPQPIHGGGTDRRHLFSFGIQDASSLFAIGSAFSVHSFVASADLLTPALLQDPLLATCEDTYLILSLLKHVDPKFSYAATAVFNQVDSQSDFANDPLRWDDEFTVQAHLQGGSLPRPNLLIGSEVLARFWKNRPSPPILSGPMVIQRIPAEVLQCIRGLHPTASSIRPCCVMRNIAIGECEIETLPEPWAYASEFAPAAPPGRGEGFFRVEMEVTSGPVGLGVLNRTETDFVVRVSVQESAECQVVCLPIPDVSKMGRLVIQNWDTPGIHVARINSVSLFIDAPPWGAK